MGNRQLKYINSCSFNVSIFQHEMGSITHTSNRNLTLPWHFKASKVWALGLPHPILFKFVLSAASNLPSRNPVFYAIRTEMTLAFKPWMYFKRPSQGVPQIIPGRGAWGPRFGGSFWGKKKFAVRAGNIGSPPHFGTHSA